MKKEERNKILVRVVCWVLAGLMVFGLGYSAVYMILAAAGVIV